jgi:UDP-glucose 4-epimerase
LRYVVTGGAGFIGSTICRQLLSNGEKIVIIDKFDALLYSAEIKKSRLNSLFSNYTFEFHELDLAKDDLSGILNEDDIVIHTAALPGQVLSWDSFEEYSSANILATKRLLDESVKNQVKNFVYSSTSSVYGRVANSDFDLRLEPHSPYGVTKLAGENLVKCYHSNFDLNVKILRYFSVYGPGQRSDMAIQIFLESIQQGKQITISGSGEQSRDFTFVADCAAATISAANAQEPIVISDISGGEIATIKEVLEICFDTAGVRVPVSFSDGIKGDQDMTLGGKINSALNFGSQERVDLRTGIAAQWESIASKETSK